jgi:hypothetical protein
MVKTMRTRFGVLLAALAFMPLAAPAAHAVPGADAGAGALVGNHIINMYSGKCLVARDTNLGTGAVQFDCGSFADQNWVLESSGVGPWKIRNAYTYLPARPGNGERGTGRHYAVQPRAVRRPALVPAGLEAREVHRCDIRK